MLGRKAVRRAIQRVRSSQTPTNTDGVTSDSNLPKPSAGIRFPGTSASMEPPLAIDSDTERAFPNNGTSWYFRRGRPTVTDAQSGTSTPADVGYTSATDPLRSPVFRRKWASDLLESRGSPDVDAPASRDHSPPRRASAQSTFFTKLGRKSVSALTLPFSSPLKSSRAVTSREPSPERHEVFWSDTSSEEELPLYDPKLVAIDADYGGPLEEDVESN